MSRMKTHIWFLRNLKGSIPRGRRRYMPKEEAYEYLKQITLQDFGYDIQAWERWFADRPLAEAMPGKIKPQTEEERHIAIIKRLRNAVLIDALKEHPQKAVLIDFWQVTKEEVLDELKLRTGQDLGYDADAWQKWFDENEGLEPNN